MVKIKSGHSADSGQNFQKQKEKNLGNIILHLCAYLWAKIPHSLRVRGVEHFLVFEKSALNGLRNGPGVRYLKFQNRSSRLSPGTPIY